MTPLEFWILMLALGLITLGIRGSFFLLPKTVQLPSTLRTMMHYIPTAVFAALSLPALWFAKPQSYELHDPARLMAGMAGALVAYFSGNVLYTITSGLLTLWLLRFGLGWS